MKTGAPLIRKTGLVEGVILQRYKRFLADVELADGSVVVAHCTNTGTMATCWEPGDRVLLETAANPERKLRFTWLACRRGAAWVGVETGTPNRVVAGRRAPGPAAGPWRAAAGRAHRTEVRGRAQPDRCAGPGWTPTAGASTSR